jgi:hypothetical protein
MKRIVPILALLAAGGLLPACADNSGNGGGDCDPACSAEDFETCCDGACVVFANDEQNCGGCGIACAPGQFCESGTCMGEAGGMDGGPTGGGSCTPECSVGQRCCGGTCVSRSVPVGTDGRSDPSFMNCNGCGLLCDSETAISCSIPGGGTEGTPRCMCGDFNACPSGSVCVNDPSVGWTCTNLSTDPNNCGAIGNACAEGESCSGGMCVCGATGARCPDGQSCCGGTCIDTSSDSLNCGGCGNVCTPNAPNCVSGSCICAESGRVCEEPTPGLPIIGGGSPGESCCPGVGCVANTNESCACEPCTGDDTCQVGGSGLFPGGGGDEVSTVCCGGEEVGLLGCGGFGLPGIDGGFFPSDGGGFGLPDGGI